MGKKSTRIIYVVGFVAVALISNLQVTHARPQYSKVFHDVFPDYQSIEASKCSICHIDQKKTSLNEYGEAVGEALGAKNVKDVKAIEEALKKAADKLPKKP